MRYKDWGAAGRPQRRMPWASSEGYSQHDAGGHACHFVANDRGPGQLHFDQDHRHESFMGLMTYLLLAGRRHFRMQRSKTVPEMTAYTNPKIGKPTVTKSR